MNEFGVILIDDDGLGKNLIELGEEISYCNENKRDACKKAVIIKSFRVFRS